MAVQQAQHEGIPFLEITDKLYKYLRPRSTDESFTEGKPGVRVFKEGCRKKILDIENLSAEAHHDYMVKQKSKSMNE